MRVVVVLAGVDQQSRRGRRPQRAADRRRLHELRPRADDGQRPSCASSPSRGGMWLPQRGQSPGNGGPVVSVAQRLAAGTGAADAGAPGCRPPARSRPRRGSRRCPAPTIAQRPIVTPGRIVLFAPSAAPDGRGSGVTSQSSSVLGVPSRLMARGTRSFVKHTCGPTNTPSSTVTPWIEADVVLDLHPVADRPRPRRRRRSCR